LSNFNTLGFEQCLDGSSVLFLCQSPFDRLSGDATRARADLRSHNSAVNVDYVKHASAQLELGFGNEFYHGASRPSTACTDKSEQLAVRRVFIRRATR
jgi:hypothetical protein